MTRKSYDEKRATELTTKIATLKRARRAAWQSDDTTLARRFGRQLYERKAELRDLDGLPKRITVPVVRAILRRHGMTIEESFSEFRVDPPVGMGFDLGELSQRVFTYEDHVVATDPRSRRSVLEEIFESVGAMVACMAPTEVDGDYEDAIREVLRTLVDTELGGVEWRHVAAWMRTEQDEIANLTTDEFLADVVDAYKIAVTRSPALSETRAKELGL